MADCKTYIKSTAGMMTHILTAHLKLHEKILKMKCCFSIPRNGEKQMSCHSMNIMRPNKKDGLFPLSC